ncbi:ABC transporter substrate-binding protein [uncultured Jatrophihabitans sp.]|uniref:ABC transporter substrate-binding protein n=1 Tax=uncultured Jatrophihabitans sp. TaxID=1610747 RepID=UPI0035C94754
MTLPVLRTVTRTQGNNRALKTGEVAPDLAVLEFVEVDPLIAAFRRMVRELAYDVCEMALTTYLTAREHGTAFTALPVFLVREFHHGAVRTRPDLAGADPRRLNGTRIGVNRGYTVTTGVWARAVLARRYGVDLDSITWVLSGDEHVASYRPPANVVSMPAGDDLGDMVARGDLTAVLGAPAREGLVPLIHDPESAAFDALAADGHWPINHLVVVRDDVLAARPGLAADLFAAFAESKRRYVEALGDPAQLQTAADRTYARVAEVTGRDPLPYGVEPNRAVLTELLDAACAQHILRERPRLEDLFAAETLELTG